MKIEHIKQNIIRIKQTACLRFLLSLVLMTSSVYAQDRISLTGTEKPVVGKITGMTNREITYETRKNGKQTVSPNRVVEIKWKAEPARFAAGRTFESKELYDKAIQAYQDALEQVDSSNEWIKTDIEYHLLRLKTKMVVAEVELPNQEDPAKLYDKIDQFLEQHKSFYAYYPGVMMLGQFAHQQGSPEAVELFVKLSETPWTDYQIWGFTAQGRQLLKEKKVDEALSLFEKALSLPYQHAADHIARAEAIIGKTECLSAQQNGENALPLLEEVIEKLPESAVETQARVYLAQGRLFQTLRQNQEATVAFLHVDILFSKAAAEHAEALFHLSKLWTALGKPDRAASAAVKLGEEYPESRWAIQLNKN